MTETGTNQPLLPAWTQRVGQPLTGTWPAGFSTVGGMLSPYHDDNEDSIAGDGSLYTKLTWALSSDPKWQREIALGKRVGLYKFRGDVGSGNFSKVKLAFHQLTHERVAVKIIDKVGLDAKGLVMLSREIDSMTKLHHPHIVRLYEVIESLNRVYLVMEYAPGGELYNQIMTEGPLTEANARSAFAQLVSAVEHMHDYGLVHRDIKAENVFIYKTGHLKLGDFGFTTALKTLDDALDTFCGSPPYAAPELFTDESYTGTGVDGWALGVLLYFMITAQMPFQANTVVGLKNQILEGRIDYLPNMSALCCDLISGILQIKVPDRLSTKRMKQHLWLKTEAMPKAFPVRTESRESLDGLLSDIEKKAKKELDDLGIPADLVESEIKKGCRSPVVGAYRIIIQRHLSKAPGKTDSPKNIEQRWLSRTPSPSMRHSSTMIIPTSPQKQNRHKLKQKLSLLAVSNKVEKSKSCCVM